MPSILLIHNIFHPDPGVSARHYTELAQGLRDRGWDVTVLATNRGYRDASEVLPAEETWEGIRILRTPRLPLDIDRPLSRLLVSVQTVACWMPRALQAARFDAVLVGSNPPFAPLLALALRSQRTAARLAHWCFDVYPDAVEADGLHPLLRPAARAARRMMEASYGSFDLIADLGPCMRGRLRSRRQVRRRTLVPWAFVEPGGLEAPDPREREELFGGAKLGVLYSGTLGRAHTFESLLGLARACRARGVDAAFAFSCRDAREKELRAALGADDANVRVADFVPMERLSARLNAADLHMMSLRETWSGISVPSKFFGSLAVGKPVLYAGSQESDIGRVITEFEAGLVVSEDRLQEAVETLSVLASKPSRLREWQARVQALYGRCFRRQVVMDAWDRELRDLLVQPIREAGA